MIDRAHVEHTLATDDVALALDRVAQRDAERLRARLGRLECGRQRGFEGARQQQLGLRL